MPIVDDVFSGAIILTSMLLSLAVLAELYNTKSIQMLVALKQGKAIYSGDMPHSLWLFINLVFVSVHGATGVATSTVFAKAMDPIAQSDSFAGG